MNSPQTIRAIVCAAIISLCAAGAILKVNGGGGSVECPMIRVNPSNRPDGAVGASFNQKITATGAAAPHKFSLAAGALPPGLKLSSAGVIAGAPTTAGDFEFSIRATDRRGCSGAGVFALKINSSGPAVITGNSERKPAGAMPAAVVGAAGHITAEQLKDYLDFIASDELEGRDTPSRGLDIAAKFIALWLSRQGLEPMGDQGSYFQRIQLRRDRIDPAQISLELNDQRFNFGDGFLAMPTSFAGTTGGPLVYVGDGWVFKAKNINAYQGIDVKGKILLTTNAGLPPGVSEADLSGRLGESWDYPMAYAQRHGAAGIILIPPQNTLRNWERQRQIRLEQNHLTALSLEEPGGTRITTGRPTRPTRLITGRWRKSRAPSLSQSGRWPTRQSARG